MESKKVEEDSNGLMEHHILEISRIITCRGKGLTYGMILGSMKEIGTIIKCMVRESLHGKMVRNTKESM